jgi:leader peptidase (prepilin peptidase) / N-methyltransferase
VNAALAALVFAPGLAIGSFLNVVAERVPLGRSIVKPRSACMSCGTEIRSRDNIPVVSYLLLRGRCRDCGTAISWRYPAFELATAVLVAGCVLAFGLSLRALAAAVFCTALVVVSSTDIERRVVPNKVVLPAVVAVLAIQLVRDPSLEWPAAGLGAALFLFLAALAYPRGMGMGDVKLAAVMGIFLGASVIPALFVGIALGALVGLGLVLRYGSAARKHAVPFGPFLAIGGVVGLLAGSQMIDAYLNAFVR